MSATLGNHDDIEMFPLRPATEKEGRLLKNCLLSVQRAQLGKSQKGGDKVPLSALNVDSNCHGLALKRHKTEKGGSEILAEKREDDNTVRWSINEQGVIEEHLDAGPDDQFLEL